MTLANLQEAVLKKAGEEATSILDEAKREAESRWKSESARLQQEHTRRIESLRAQLEAALDRDVGARQAENRLELLRMKNEIIEQVFQQAVEGLLKLPDGGYRRLLKAQLAKLPHSPGSKVAVAPRDREMVAQLIRELGREGELAVADEPAPIQGGFLLQGRGRDLDFSIEGLLSVMRESLAESVARELFEAEAG